MKATILLIEDTDEIRNGLDLSLRKENYNVYAFPNAEAALDSFESNHYDLILLDLMLPKMNGEEFLDRIREYQIPIIIISALNDEFTQINLYHRKIDDYVVKPFSVNILLLKIDALLRRIETNTQNSSKKILYKNIMIEIGNYIVEKNGEKVTLTAKEFEILQAMLLNQGKVFSRDEFLTALWGYDYYVDSRTIDVHIKNLRNKLGKNLINTLKGVGYRIEKE
ncbi:hypothetical protein A5819_001308 [Enterococcus sp. 7E2_DIV0204]|uniref:response regulator transcription factor n=1 Tax=unclassified Enterococcus TaxID=2608891 RepID=UPI000A33DC7A|nr:MULTISPECIES: response regulator transcription factor [unclassified Enterococcus]OTN88816.1 hypothetical protein A5819_001308 [Enterococcus sp. 7E2_DIV0204]OTP51281.1 hypothetical protein A5884_000476 [Enterococcus sp. 7D2_DIV0200]